MKTSAIVGGGIGAVLAWTALDRFNAAQVAAEQARALPPTQPGRSAIEEAGVGLARESLLLGAGAVVVLGISAWAAWRD